MKYYKHFILAILYFNCQYTKRLDMVKTKQQKQLLILGNHIQKLEYENNKRLIYQYLSLYKKKQEYKKNIIESILAYMSDFNLPFFDFCLNSFKELSLKIINKNLKNKDIFLNNNSRNYCINDIKQILQISKCSQTPTTIKKIKLGEKYLIKTQLIKFWENLVLNYCIKQDTSNTIKYFKIFRTLSFKAKQTDSLNYYLGYLYLNNNQTIKAFSEFQFAINVLNTIKQKSKKDIHILINLYHELSLLFQKQNNISKSIEIHTEATTLIDQLKDVKSFFNIYYNLGLMYFKKAAQTSKQDLYTKANKNFNKAISNYCDKKINKNNLANAYYLSSVCFLINKKFECANNLVAFLLDFDKQYLNYYNLYLTYKLAGDINFFLDKKKATTYYNECISILHKNKFNISDNAMPHLYMQLGILYYTMDNINTKRNITKSKLFFTQLLLSQKITEVTKVISLMYIGLCYEKTKEYKKAFENSYKKIYKILNKPKGTSINFKNRYKTTYDQLKLNGMEEVGNYFISEIYILKPFGTNFNLKTILLKIFVVGILFTIYSYCF